MFAGQEVTRGRLGADLYQTEPVARAVLDRCDELVRGEHGISLLDVMYGRIDPDTDKYGSQWELSCLYALQCVLTAQWASLGVQPSAIVADGFGWLAAAQAAGMCSLEDGLRIAAVLGEIMKPQPGQDPASTLSDLEDALGALNLGIPSVPLMDSSGASSQEFVEVAEITRWLRQEQEALDFIGCARSLADLEVDVVLQIGSASSIGEKICSKWPESSEATAVTSALTNIADGSETHDADGGLLRAVASLYEAGVNISFEGLFVGESRRRISVPTYPFQRRRHWF